MGTIYIGGQNKKKGRSFWKLYLFLALFFVVVGSALKVSAPMIVEQWINRKGAEAAGYAFSVRAVDLALGKGQVNLVDVKVFNPETSAKLLETPNLTVQLNWQDLVLSQDKKVGVSADKMDVYLSKDFTSELKRIEASKKKFKNDYYLNLVEATVGELNLIEQKEELSRTVLALTNVNLRGKEFSLLSINKKTEFTVTSDLADGGKLNLTGRTSEVNGAMPWTIQGSLKKVPSDIFNKMAGAELPFSFNEAALNAEITARSEQGKVSGEIKPAIEKLNLIDEKPGFPTQTISRLLNEELTFTLPFSLKDELTLQYEEQFKKLKAYRKYPAATEATPAPATAKKAEPAVKVNKTAQTKEKKGFSFWPF